MSLPFDDTIGTERRADLPLIPADLIESENDFQVYADLPGAENLDISMENGILSISAERKEVLHDKDNDIAHTVERRYGKVNRRMVLPSNAESDRATARYKDGVLSISMPKKDVSNRKKLNIE